MTLQYLKIEPDAPPPDISALKPFQVVVIIEAEVSADWQALISSWLVKSGCFFMMAWGNNCNSWDDSVDHANLACFDYGEVPDDQFVMTTWHEKEPLNEVFWFSHHCAFHPVLTIENTLLLHIATESKEKKFLSAYAEAKETL